MKYSKHWRFLYLSPYSPNRKLCTVDYKQPHQGGQVTKKSAMLRAFPKVKHFAMSKIVCASLLRSLRKAHGIEVAAQAVSRELAFGQESFRCKVGEEGIDSFVKSHCHFTLVTHGVNFHVDFGKGSNTSFLENRIVVVSERNPTEPNVPEGRGYKGKQRFAYALIDW